MSDKDALREMYVERELSSAQIGKALGLSDTHIRRLLKKNNIPLRTRSEAQRLCTNRPEVREKMSRSARGRKHGESAKQKLRERVGAANHNWRNGLTTSTQGYLCFTASEGNGEHAGRALHVILAEWKYGRKIKPGEHVHHIDGNRLNNHPDNLEILLASDHAHKHAEDRENGKIESV